MMTKPYSFRKIEDWKSALMLLPDSSFFDLMRSIFGNIKTPFNKQKLLEELFILLSRDDVRSNIQAYINADDHKIIAATALLEDPSPEELEHFFERSLSASMRVLIANLEERLILYRFRDEEKNCRRLALNPALESVLAPFAAGRGIIFSSENAPGKTAPLPASVKDDRIFASMIAFFLNDDDLYRITSIRKKVIERWKQLFPDTDIETMTGTLRQLGLFTPNGDKFISADRKIRDFGALPVAQRRGYIASGHYLHLTEKKNENSPNAETSGLQFGAGLPRNRLRRFAGLIHRICGYLEPQKNYPDFFFHRLLTLLERDEARDIWREKEKTDLTMLLNVMEIAGIIEKQSAENRGSVPSWMFVSDSAQNQKQPGEGPVIAMDSAFSIILYPGISFSDALGLAFFSSVKEDNPFCFELTRASVVKGFDRGISAEAMIKLLMQLSGNRIEENLEWTLNDWESRYASVSLHEGLILNLSEERRYLAETGPVASLIKKNLGQGLYLLSGEKSEAAAALLKAGVDIIAQPDPSADSGEGSANEGSWRQASNRAFLPLDSFEIKINLDEDPVVSAASPDSILDQFRLRLKNLKLPKPENDELLSRIDRRVIITERQLEKAVIKYEKLEAKGLDYQGKLAIAKQAIAEGSLIEITWPNLDGTANVNEGIPEALEKKGTDSILVLNSNDNIIRIPLGKISILRKYRQSIFK